MNRLGLSGLAILRLALWLVWGPAAAAGLEAGFETANRLTAEGRFAEGAAAYDSLPTGGKTSAALEYNRGLARLKAGQPGLALAHLRLAERLAPRDASVTQALDRLALRLPGSHQDRAGLVRLLELLTLNEWAGIALVLVWIWSAMLLAGLKPSWRIALRGYAFGAGVLAVGAVALLAGAWWARMRSPDATIVRPDTLVRVSPLDEARGAFSLAEGTEVHSRSQRDDWIMIEEPVSRRFGWVKRDAAVVLPLK